jgi:hypothetical protein
MIFEKKSDYDCKEENFPVNVFDKLVFGRCDPFSRIDRSKAKRN